VPNAASAPASRPFDPKGASLSIVAYRGQRWTPLSGCPPEVGPAKPGAPQPRLCAADGTLVLFWSGAAAGDLNSAQLDIPTGTWIAGVDAHLPGATLFSTERVNRVLTLLTVPPGSPAQLSAYQLRTLTRPDVPEWHATELKGGALPNGVNVAAVLGTAAFNQQLALLVRGSDQQAYIQFVRPGDMSAENTIAVAQVFAGPPVFAGRRVWQLASFFAVVVVFALLFLFRRGSLLQSVTLPAGLELAFIFHRLGAWLIDFVPFALASAALAGVGLSDVVQQLSAFTIGSEDGGLPAREVLLWWAYAAGGYVAYATIIELAAGRTVGKMIVGLQVVSERGATPSVGQRLARNLVRLVELEPHFWILAFLPVISRNRQRLGDVFARTLVAKPATPEGAKGDGQGGEKREERPSSVESGDGGGQTSAPDDEHAEPPEKPG
jgi:uncharacterized RDD family membrane protein YckC